MLRVIVVDDEPLARQRMRQLLGKLGTVDLVGEAGSVATAAELIERLKPDAVFLDIEMHSATGFDLLRDLTDAPDVVFVTAHNQYAVKAYDVAALDYLLKPVKPARLAAAIAKLEKSRAERDRRRQNGIPVLRLKTRARTIIVRIDSIIAMRAEGDYTRVLAADMPPTLAGQSLGKIEAMVPKPPFARLNRSLIVNIERLIEIKTVNRDTTRVRLDGCAEEFVLGRAAVARIRNLTAKAAGTRVPRPK